MTTLSLFLARHQPRFSFVLAGWSTLALAILLRAALEAMP
jgi:hypothetical protein